MTDLAAFRAAFPITASRSYLFSGGLAPAATPVRAAMDAWIDTWTTDPAAHRADYFSDLAAVRHSLARLLGCDGADLAITDTTSRAANLAVAAVPLRAGANVVVDATTHPSMRLPWALPGRRPVEVRSATGPLGTDAIAALVDRSTAAVIVSHVDGITGFRHDLSALAEVAHRAGAVLAVDAAQSVGAIGVDVAREGVDLLAGLSMKWLLGPPGVGFLFVARHLREGLRVAAGGGTAADPPHVGYLHTAIGADGRLEHAAGADRHELGVGNLAGYAGFRAALELVETVGLEAIERTVIGHAERIIGELRGRGMDVLTPAGRQHAGVVAFRHRRAEALAADLRARHVDVWGYDDTHRVRVDPHAFVDGEDIDRFLAGLDAFER